MLLLTLLSITGVVKAQEENVKAKIGEECYATLQAAIDEAILMSGDVTIEIFAGTYADEINLTNASVTTGNVDSRPNITFKAGLDEEVIFAGTTTLGYRQQNVGASMWQGEVTFEGIKFNHAEDGKHSIDIQDVKSIALINCNITGDGEYGIGSNGSNATPKASFTNCTFENGAMQVLGQLSANLVIDGCTFNEFCVNAQGGAKPGLTIKNSEFNLTLTDAHVGESFYAVRSNANPINIQNTKVTVDSKVSSVAVNQEKWGIFWARRDGKDVQWNISSCEVNLTDAAMVQAELPLTKNDGTTYAYNRIILKDLTSTSNNIEDLVKKTEGCATINGADYKDGELDLTYMVAKIDGKYYKTLADAVTAVQENGTITLIKDEIFTKDNRALNSGTWYDGLYYVGDKSFTIDVNNYTIKHDGSVNDYLLNFKNVGSKKNTITLKNGTIDAGTSAYCAICTSSAQDNELTINTENIKVINNNSNGSTIKIRGGAVLNVKTGTVITGQDSYLGIECNASTVNIFDGAEIYMNGSTSYNGCLAGAAYAGTINVYGGKGKGVKGGFIAMTSGGTINISGGEWTSNTDGTVGNNSNLYVLTAQSNKNESGFAGASIINVKGGTFRGGMDAWVLNNIEGEKAELIIYGGNFNVNPEKWVTEKSIVSEKDGIYIVQTPVAKIDDTNYFTLASAFSASKAGETVKLVNDVTVDKAISVDKLVTLDFNEFNITRADGYDGYVFEVTGDLPMINGGLGHNIEKGATCYIINDNDYKTEEGKTFALKDNQMVDIEYNRTFGHTDYQVLYVPFAIPFNNIKDDFDVYSITNISDVVELTQITDGTLEANVPYMIKAKEAGDKTIKVSYEILLGNPTEYTQVLGDYTITGTYTSKAIEAGQQYVLTNGEWCQLSEAAVTNEQNILGAFRVYLTANGASNASVLRNVINGENATAIDELKATENVNGVIYDLSGRRVEKAVKGIFVVNGKKVVK